jgi:hypothetical protein
MATFTVTNISNISVTPVNQTVFPAGSGLAVTSTTCSGLLAPRQSCTMQVSLQAPPAGRAVATALKVWAQPSADGVEYPISFTVTPGLPTITLVPVGHGGLPALRDPIVATSNGEWLVLGGSTGGFHDFNSPDFTTNIYVYNPNTAQTYSLSYAAAGVPLTVQQQLTSTEPDFLQDGDTLYIIGGYANLAAGVYTTVNTITSINIPNAIASVKAGTSLASSIVFRTDIPQFKVTGGQIGKIGNYFYLAFGQDCEGDYCAASQTYTNTIYQFTTTPLLTSVNFGNIVTHSDNDGSGWRRRDYTLVPFMQGGTETLFAMGGPFTPGANAVVWTNGILFDVNINSNQNFINQQANQYLVPHLSMYSASSNTSYVATFAGLSNLYWAPSGLKYDNTTPYGNVLDLISLDASGNVQEYLNLQPLCSGQPLASCLYMGLSAEFIPVADYYDSRDILQLDQISSTSPTLVGYVYAGLVSTVQEIFGGPNNATNNTYAVYVTPAGSGATSWLNVTNLEPGN